MKKIIFLLLVMIPNCVAAEVSTLTPEEADLIFGVLRWSAGEYYGAVVLVLFALGFIWAQVRQFIKPQTLAKAPEWLITVLEGIAANRGHAKNQLSNNPIHIKRTQ